jgi:hypothetical protein
MLSGFSVKRGSGLLQFSPTYNGAQDPSVVGGSSAEDEYSDLGPGSAAAESHCDMKVNVAAGDAIINIVGTASGNTSAVAQASTDIFELNDTPDEIRITLDSSTESGVNEDYDGTHTKIGTFTDDAFFSPTASTDYGYDTDSQATASDPPSGPSDGRGSGTHTLVVTFTFRKTGYADLSVTYKITTFALADAEDVS